MIYLFDEEKKLTGTVRDAQVRALRFARERNGLYESIAEIPVISYDKSTENNLHTKTKDAVFFGHYDLEDRFQLFKVAAYDVDSGMIRIHGVHLFFDEAKAGAIIRERRYINREISDGARDALAEIGWQMADFDVSPARTYNFYNVSPLEARAKLIETFNYEFDYWLDFDGKKISGKYFSVKRRIGSDNGRRYVYNKHVNNGNNVLSLRAEQDFSEVYTAVIGRGRGEEYEDTGGYGRRIEFTDIEWKRPNDPLDKPLGRRILHDPEASQAFGYVEGNTVKPRIAVVEFTDIEEQDELIEATYDWLVEHRQPKLLFDVSVADGDGLDLGDTVYVKYNDIKLNLAVRVGKVTEDIKTGERHVELGDVSYFKPGRSNRDIKRSIAQARRDASDRIFQLKLAFDENFDKAVQQMRDDYEQALIDAYSAVEAAEVRMTDLINSERDALSDKIDADIAQARSDAENEYARIESEVSGAIDSTRSEMETAFESKVADAREYADSQIADKESQYEADWNQRDSDIQQTIETVVGGSVDALDTNLLDVNSRLLSKLDESDLQPLNGRIDDAFSDISDVSGDLATTRSELQKQLDDAFSDISDVSGNLDTARSELQEQLDDARAELEGIEVGGRNLLPSFHSDKWHAFSSYVEVLNEYTLFNSGENAGATIGQIYVNVEPNTEYTISSYTDYGRTNVWGYIDGENNGAVFNFVTGTFSRTFNTGDNNEIRIALGRYSGEDRDIIFRHPMLTKGNIKVDWTPAPEDTEAKITNLSESIEYIDGQLEAKLNRTEIEPIQNKITEYGTTLDANAESIGLLQDKTQLHDDDIEKWSNQATSTAEEVSRILTHNSEQDGLITSVTNESRETAEGLERIISRVSETESGISTAKVDIKANADLIGATMTRVDGNDRAIGEFQATADGLKADFTRYQSDFGNDMSAIQSQVASYEANVDGFRAEVGVLSKDVSSVESWQREKGAVIDGNADAIRTRIWKNDIDAIEVGGRNYLESSKERYRDSRNTGNSSDNYNFETYYPTQELTGQVTVSGFIEFEEGTSDSVTILLRNSDNRTISQLTLDIGEDGYFEGKADVSQIIHRAFIYMGRYEQTRGNGGYLRLVKLEKGNKATDWTPAPEDIQSDITQLYTDITIEAGRINGLLTRTSEVEQSIADVNLSVDGITADFANYKRDIDSDVGSLSAQVASYEASVDGFRAEVGTLQGDINDLESWRNDKGSLFEQAAEGFRQQVWTRDIAPLTQRLDGHEAQISDLQLTADRFGVTIGEVESGLIDRINEIDTWYYNLLRGSRLDESGQIALSSSRGTIMEDEDIPYFRANPTAPVPYFGLTHEFHMEGEKEYTFSIDYRTTEVPILNYITFISRDGTSNSSFHGLAHEGNHYDLVKDGGWRRAYFRFYPPRDLFGNLRIGVSFGSMDIVSGNFDLRLPYLTETSRTEWLYHQLDATQNLSELTSRISSFEQTVDQISATVQDIDQNVVKQSQVYVGASGVQIGSTFIGDSQFASIFRVSPRTIDAVAEQMRVSGDLYVKGEIQSFAMEAVEGEFARLWADSLGSTLITADHIDTSTLNFSMISGQDALIERLVARTAFVDAIQGRELYFSDGTIGRLEAAIIRANVIKSDHIEASISLINKMFANSARIDQLITKTHFVDNIKAMSIEAVYADIRSVNSEIMDTNILKADWIQGGNALLDKVFANTAMFERMMAKSGFVRTLSAITLDLHELTIWRPDGVAFVQNGMERFGHPVMLETYMDDGVTFDGKFYETRNNGSSIVKIATGDHAGRYYNLVVGVGSRYSNSWASIEIAVVIRVQNRPSGTSWGAYHEERFTVQTGSMDYHTISYPLGRPTYGGMQFSVEFYVVKANAGTNDVARIRFGRSWVSA